MKKQTVMKPVLRTLSFWVVCLLLMVASGARAQDAATTDEPDNRPVKNIFNSTMIIDNQTVLVPIKGTFEFDIQHRFGTWQNGYEDFWGLYAPSNIRLGFGYVPVDKLMVGFGLSKKNLTWDFNAKYAILTQTRSGSMPVSLTYYGNVSIDTRNKDKYPNPAEFENTDRYSYFNQLLIARKISDDFSIQAGASISHFNTVTAYEDTNGDIVQDYNNDHIAVEVMAKYTITPTTSIIFNYDQPLTQHETYDPQPNLSIGVELKTSSHQFQFFLGNFPYINPQLNNVFNTNSFGDNEILLGFNMTRLWN